MVEHGEQTLEHLLQEGLELLLVEAQRARGLFHGKHALDGVAGVGVEHDVLALQVAHDEGEELRVALRGQLRPEDREVLEAVGLENRVIAQRTAQLRDHLRLEEGADVHIRIRLRDALRSALA